MKYSKNKELLTKFTIFLLLIEIIFTQKVSELIQPKCTNKKVEYSILANMKEYLENENNIDGRKFYSNIEDLKEKNAKVGALSFIKLDDFTNVEKYDSVDDLLEALRKHKVDAIFTDNTFINYTQINTHDLSQIPGELKTISPTFVSEKNSSIYQKLVKFQSLMKESGRYFDSFYKWMGINEEGYYINKTLDTKNEIIKALFFYYPPLVFKNENDELVGSSVSFLYGFCHVFGYQLDIQVTTSIDELDKAIKNKSFDLVNYFIQDDISSEYSYFIFSSQPMNPIIRYSSHPDSATWSIFDSPEQFDGEPLGCLNQYSFEYLYKEKFPNSKVEYYDNNYDLLYSLLKEDIEGFLIDESIAKNNVKKFPNRITYYDMNITNELGFGFKKNDDTLLKEFNQFLEKPDVDVEKIYEKWNVKDTSGLIIEKDNYKGEKIIKVGLLVDSKPFCYKENDELKGIEADLLYQFAKSKNYNVNLVEFMNSEDRMKIGEKNTDFDITGGQFTITEERSKTISFSNPIYKVGTSLVVRTDSKIDTMKLSIFDNEYNKIPDNKAKLISKIGDKSVTSLCTFPEIFNYTLTLECLINDLNGTDPFSQGIESTTTEDKLQIVYSYLEIDNILKGNEKLNLPIIQESDKTEKICSEENRIKESNIFPIIAGSAIGATLLGLVFIALRFCF